MSTWPWLVPAVVPLIVKVSVEPDIEEKVEPTESLPVPTETVPSFTTGIPIVALALGRSSEPPLSMVNEPRLPP